MAIGLRELGPWNGLSLVNLPALGELRLKYLRIMCWSDIPSLNWVVTAELQTSKFRVYGIADREMAHLDLQTNLPLPVQ